MPEPMPVTPSPHPLDLAYAPTLSALHLERSRAHWEQASVTSRAHWRCDLDLPYGVAASERLDVFYPKLIAGQRSKGIMIFIHGGYWRALDKSNNSFVADAICAKGYTAVLPNYALCPGNTIEGIIKQLLACCAWVFRNATQLGSRADCISVAGHSAGGHLAAMMLAARFDWWAQDLPNNLLKAGLSISGLYDLTPHAKAPFLRSDIRLQSRSQIAKVSPVHYAAPRAPLLTVLGALEPSGFHLQDAQIASQWGNKVKRIKPLLGHDHFTILSALADPASAMTTRLQSVLQMSSATLR
jgi:arylformamidase